MSRAERWRKVATCLSVKQFEVKEAAGPATGGLGFYCQSSAAQETLAREVISFSEKTCYTLSLFF